MEGFLYLYNMKLLDVLKELIIESYDTYYGGFTHDNKEFKIYGSEHSQEATKTSAESGRYDVDELVQVIMDFKDIYGDLAVDVIKDREKNSILTFDNLLNVNFLTYVNKKGKNVIDLKIHTSLKNRRKLNIKPQNKVLVITKSGDTIIKEQIDTNNFTKIVRGDIIIYHN